jgi:hypothetical protein
LNYASDVLLGPSFPKDSDFARHESRSPEKQENKSRTFVVTPDESVVPGPVSLEEDLRLVDLAAQSARCMHRIRGHEFDETYNIDISRDIKFSVVDLDMPLGLIFQENEVGCWVTKVLPTGSAIRNGKVQVGDQLAAIDGKSAINMKVGVMADIVTAKRADVELTFLRYIGPLHPMPGSVCEEGYEVRARTKGVKATPRQKMLRMKIPRGRRKTASPSIEDEKKESDETPSKSGFDKRRFRFFGRKKGGEP